VCRFLNKELFTVLILMIFVGQSFANINSACTHEKKMNHSVNLALAESSPRHEVMAITLYHDHENQSDIYMSTPLSNEHQNTTQLMQSMDSDCCQDKCQCEYAHCNTSLIIPSSNLHVLSSISKQSVVISTDGRPLNQYVNYLFKPPILS